jgi:hypothetical protein
MVSLYSIVPSDDGYHVLGRDKDNNFILISKSANDQTGELIFLTSEEAQVFIEQNNLKGYKVEGFLKAKNCFNENDIIRIPSAKIDTNIYCPDCGYTLTPIATIGADEAFSETLYSCTKDECLCDFSVIRDKEGHFVKMTRYFWK